MFRMKNRLAAVTAFGLAFAVAPLAARAADYTADKAQVLAIEKTMAAAQSMAELAPYIDPNIVFDDLTPGRVVGVKAFSTDVAAQFAQIKNLHDTILKMDVDADDQLAFANSIQRFSFTSAGGQAVSVVFRQTDCYHRADGKWLMVDQHLSVPYNPKTGKAVFDETP